MSEYMCSDKNLLDAALIEVMERDDISNKIRLKQAKYLVYLGADVNGCNEKKCSLLEMAINTGDREFVDCFLSNEKLDIKQLLCYDGEFLLDKSEFWKKHDASYKVEIIDKLFEQLKKNVSANEFKEVVNIFLCCACKCNELEVAKKLVNDMGANVNHQSDIFDSNAVALYYACLNGNCEMVDFLYQNGGELKLWEFADIWQEDKIASSMLLAGIRSGNTDVVKYMFEKEGGGDLKLNNAEMLSEAVKSKNVEMVKYVLDKGVDVNGVNENGETALIVLAQNDGKKEIAEVLLANGADVGAKCKGKEALFFAVREENVELIEYLAENGVDVLRMKNYKNMFAVEKIDVLDDLIYQSNEKEKAEVLSGKKEVDIETLEEWLFEEIRYNRAPLMERMRKIKYFIDKGARLSVEEDLLSPLHVAVKCKEKEITKLLIYKGADVNQYQNSYKKSPLLLACENGDEEMVKILVGRGGSFTGNESSTPLIEAVKSGNISLVEWLVDRKLDINGVDKNGFTTPLIAAAEVGNKEMVEALLDMGASVKVKVHGSGLVGAVINGGNVEIMDKIVEKGVDLDVQFFWKTPLMLAVMCGNAPMVKYLIEKGVDVNEQNFEGNNVLNDCGGRNVLDEPNGEIVDMLLKAGVDVYKPDNYDELFFSNMVEKGWINTVKILLENGVDFYQKDGRGDVFKIAYENNNHNILLLLSKEAKRKGKNLKNKSSNSSKFNFREVVR